MKFAQPNPRQLMSQNVQAQIRDLMLRNGFRRGDKLPTYRELCRRFDASIVTVQKAVHELGRAGVVQIVHGKGCFVANEVSDTPRELRRIGLVYHGSRMGMLLQPYLNQILMGLLLYADHRQMDLTIFSVHAAKGHLPATLVTDAVDGVIMLGNQTDAYLGEFVREHVPMVVVDHVTQLFALDYLACDNARAAEAILTHLLKLGHRRIAYLEGDLPVDWDILERRQSLATAAKRRGVQVQTVTPAGLREAVRSVARGAPEAPTAFVGKDTQSVRDLMRELDAADVSVPGQVSVAAIIGAENDEHVGQHTVTRCRVDFMGMGQKAARLLMARCRSRHPVRRRIHRAPGVLVPGSSTGTCPR